MGSISQHNPVRLFVSHAFEPSDDYHRVFEYLESSHNFYYRNCSNPDFAGSSREAMKEELRKQINLAEVVIALPALYEVQPDQTIFQMNYAKSQKKPVLLMQYFGTARPLPKLLLDRCAEDVNWEERAMVDAIKRHARGENTARFETVEFNPDEFKDFKL